MVCDLPGLDTLRKKEERPVCVRRPDLVRVSKKIPYVKRRRSREDEFSPVRERADSNRPLMKCAAIK